MTQQSYLWNGLVKGDASLSPYSDAVLGTLINHIYGGNSTLVIPYYLNNLNINAVGLRSVSIDTGGAWINGVWYKNDSVKSLSIAQNLTGYTRIDRIVVRVDRVAKTARLVVLTGIAEAVPKAPVIRNTENVFDLPLYRVYMESGMGVIPFDNVLDERVFANNSNHLSQSDPGNRVNNGDFIAWSVETRPDDWDWVGTPVITRITRFDELPYGYAIRVQATTVNHGISTWVLTHLNTASVFTVRVLVRVVVGTCKVIFAGSTKVLPVSETPYTHQLIEFRVSTSGMQTLQILGGTGSDVFEVGFVSVTYGYIPGEYDNYSVVSRIIIHEDPVVADPPWDGLTALSTGVVSNPSSIVEPTLPHGAKQAMVRLAFHDTGSAGSAPGVVLNTSPVSIVISVASLPNSTQNQAAGWVELPESSWDTDANFWIQISVTASGAGTAFLSLRILGIVV